MTLRLLAITCVIGAVLNCTQVQSRSSEYQRSDWPHWVDDDGDCEDTRQEVLIAESLTPAIVNECKVISGTWRDPYSGLTLVDPGQLDVDHMVPLAHAHYHGAKDWDRARRQAYANDLSHPEHLVAVSARLNRQKGARGPDQWRPPNGASHCWYANSWLDVKGRWGLWISRAERDALVQMLASCGSS